MKDEIRELYSKGIKLKDISDQLSVSIPRIKYYIYSLGFRPAVIPKERLTKCQQIRIRQLLLFGDYNFSEIAEDVGVKKKDIREFVEAG